jgi:hypothetical protein
MKSRRTGLVGHGASIGEMRCSGIFQKILNMWNIWETWARWEYNVKTDVKQDSDQGCALMNTAMYFGVP